MGSRSVKRFYQQSHNNTKMKMVVKMVVKMVFEYKSTVKRQRDSEVWCKLRSLVGKRLESESWTFDQVYYVCMCVWMTVPSLDGLQLNPSANNCWWMGPLCGAFYGTTEGLQGETITELQVKMVAKMVVKMKRDFFINRKIQKLQPNLNSLKGMHTWTCYSLMWMVLPDYHITA